jgi:flavodoxin
MRIGIVVHSGTGVTLALAGRAAEELGRDGHQVEVMRLEPEGEVQPHQKGIVLKNVPDVTGFDLLVVGGPIWAMAMSPVTLAFARGNASLAGRRVIPLATMAFPFAFMGGSAGIGALSKALRDSGARVLRGVIMTQMLHDRERQQARALARIRGQVEETQLAG